MEWSRWCQLRLQTSGELHVVWANPPLCQSTGEAQSLCEGEGEAGVMGQRGGGPVMRELMVAVFSFPSKGMAAAKQKVGCDHRACSRAVT